MQAAVRRVGDLRPTGLSLAQRILRARRGRRRGHDETTPKTRSADTSSAAVQNPHLHPGRCPRNCCSTRSIMGTVMSRRAGWDSRGGVDGDRSLMT